MINLLPAPAAYARKPRTLAAVRLFELPAPAARPGRGSIRATIPAVAVDAHGDTYRISVVVLRNGAIEVAFPACHDTPTMPTNVKPEGPLVAFDACSSAHIDARPKRFVMTRQVWDLAERISRQCQPDPTPPAASLPAAA